MEDDETFRGHILGNWGEAWGRFWLPVYWCDDGWCTISGDGFDWTAFDNKSLWVPALVIFLFIWPYCRKMAWNSLEYGKICKGWQPCIGSHYLIFRTHSYGKIHPFTLFAVTVYLYKYHIIGLVQEGPNSSALAMEFHLSWTNGSICLFLIFLSYFIITFSCISMDKNHFTDVTEFYCAIISDQCANITCSQTHCLAKPCLDDNKMSIRAIKVAINDTNPLCISFTLPQF